VKDPHKVIDQLSSNDALAILKALAREDEALAARIAEIAIARLREIDPEDVAFDLYEELNALEVEEVWDRAGSTRHGYVDTPEAASEMIQEVIDHYFEELKKYQALGMQSQADAMCRGLLLGLYKFEHESTSEFKGWATDAPGGFAWVVVDAWKAGAPSRTDVKALKMFIEEALGGWCAHLV
jgi:hypothetical protein